MSKMKPVEDGGSRIAIVFSGSPLFSGGAGSGESEIRRWIIENDWLEAVVALPDQLFYNTGISTYFWVVTNRKTDHRKGRIVLLDARAEGSKMRKSLGEKRKYVSDERIADLTALYNQALGESSTDQRVKVFDNTDFGYRRIVVERPKVGADGQPVRKGKGLLADADLRENETVSLSEDIDDYMKREVLPYVPDAWADAAKTKVGYEIAFTRHFYQEEPARPLASIDAEIQQVEQEIQRVLGEVAR